jgi:hypothetical protein
MSVLTDLLGSIVKQVLGSAEQQSRPQTAAGAPAKRMPAGESADGLLPPMAGPYRRVRVNDRFGGARSGGIFAGYDVDGIEVRVFVWLCPSPAAALERVREAGDGVAGSRFWSRGPYCYSAASNETEGDEGLPATPEQVAALDRFIAAFPF